MQSFAQQYPDDSQQYTKKITNNDVSLHKINYTRQFENKFSLRSFVLSLHKIDLITKT